MVEVKLVYLDGCKVNRLDLPVAQVLHCGETNVAAQGDKEWDLIHEEDISRQVHLMVELH